MVRLYFGLPGAGKTTLLVANCIKDVKSKRYKHVYTNIRNTIPGVTYIDNDCIGRYDLRDCAIHIDEATLFADSRAYKEFGKDKMQYFLEHRHYRADISLYTQQWDGVDRKIRVITDRCYYVYKTPLTGWFRTKYYRIPYGIIIPDPKKSDSEKLGEIVQGYCKPSFLQRLMQGGSVWRRRYYKYFDSFDCPPLDPLPDNYQPNPVPFSARLRRKGRAVVERSEVQAEE